MPTTQRQLIRMSLRLLVAAPLVALASLAPTPVHAAGILGASFSMPPNNLGLVGYWPFDGKYLSTTTVTDVSGQGNNGTLVNGPIPTIGKIGQALNLFPNGSDTNAYANLGDPASGVLDFGTGDFSVGFWAKGAGFLSQGSGVNIPVAKRSFNSAERGYGFYYGSGNTMVFVIYNGTAGYAAVDTAATTNDNRWHHYVGIRSGSTMYLYRDGVLRGSAAVSGDCSTSYALTVGTDGSFSVQRNANASVDDIRIYNRALSATEIAQLYTQGSGNHISTSPNIIGGATSGLSSGLVGYWPFDGKYLTTTTVTDVSGQGNNGTLVNGPIPTIGKIGQALKFNGTNQKVSFGVTNVSIGAPVTLSAWAKFPLTGDKNIVARWGTPASHGSFNFLLNSTDCYVKYSGSNEIARVSYSEPGAGWHLVTCVATSGNIPSVYVDGVLSATGGDGAFASDGTNMTEVSIGARNNAPSADLYTGGTIDDIRIYNRALSATEVAQLYTQGSGNHISTSPQVIKGAPAGLSSGLVGYWPFDGKYLSTTTATDASGQGNNGTLVNGPTPAIGRIGQALSFNGTTQYVNVPDSPSIGVVGAITITAWVKINNFSVYNSIAGKAGSAAGNIPASYDFYLNLNTGIPTLSRGSGGSGGASTSYYFTNGTTAPATGVWQFIAVTDTGCNSGTVTHYLNGNQNGSGSLAFSDACANTANALRIGSRQDGALHMNGQMDDVRIYNRALSATEIRQLYKQGGGF